MGHWEIKGLKGCKNWACPLVHPFVLFILLVCPFIHSFLTLVVCTPFQTNISEDCWLHSLWYSWGLINPCHALLCEFLLFPGFWLIEQFAHICWQTADQIELKFGVWTHYLWDSPGLINLWSCSNMNPHPGLWFVPTLITHIHSPMGDFHVQMIQVLYIIYPFKCAHRSGQFVGPVYHKQLLYSWHGGKSWRQLARQSSDIMASLLGMSSIRLFPSFSQLQTCFTCL